MQNIRRVIGVAKMDIVNLDDIGVREFCSLNSYG